MPAGRPPRFKTNEELEERINEYFELLDESKETKKEKGVYTIHRDVTPTITGLCIYLGFVDRQSFYDYAKKDEFSCTLKNARTAIENHYEQSLANGSPTGAIFALKNFGWQDKQVIEEKSERTTQTIVNIIEDKKDG